MKKHRRHIIAIVVTALISVTLYAARTNSDRLSLLQPLLEYNHPFSPDAPVDSIIAWEKLLEPELQKEQHAEGNDGQDGAMEINSAFGNCCS